MSRSWVYFGISAALAVAAACSPVGGSGAGTAGDGAGGNAGGTTTQGGGGIVTQGGDGGLAGFPNGPGGSTTTGNACDTPKNYDDDGDGFTEDDGDCNDCDKNVNPGAIEVIAEPDEMGNTPAPADEDCDGTPDNVAPLCDDNLQIGDTDPDHGANAIDLCQKATANDKKWGVLSAKYVRANGAGVPNTLQFGLISKFGNNVNTQAGGRMLALSAGNARDLDDPNPCNSQSCHTTNQGQPPPNFPQQVCNAAPTIFDDVALDLKIRTPKNATGYSFNFKFYSFEFAEWVCTSYNDQFIALVSPAPPGAINGNVSFDSKNNPVSVNIGFFDVCDPITCDNFAAFCISNCPAPPNPCCPSGPTELSGTGFDTWGDAGGTSWLKTQAPVTGGQELSIRFTIWDAGDENLDSTVLVDNFEWIANGGTVTLITEEIPEPK